MVHSKYINGLTEDLHLNPKLFSDYTTLFSIANTVAQSNSQLSADLTKISYWAYKWRICFNPHYMKLAHELVFSRKGSKTDPLLIMKNNVSVKCVQFHKHFPVILDSKRDFNQHINTVLFQVHKIIAFLQKFQHIIPRHSFIAIYKTFIRPHLDYGDVVYDKMFN